MLRLRDGDPAQRAKVPGLAELKLIVAGEVDAVSVVDPEINRGNENLAWPHGDTPHQLALSMANHGPLNTPRGRFFIAVDGFSAAQGAGPLALQVKVGTGNFTDVVRLRRAVNQRRVEFSMDLSPLFTGGARLEFRAVFTDGVNNLNSWTVLLEEQ